MLVVVLTVLFAPLTPPWGEWQQCALVALAHGRWGMCKSEVFCALDRLTLPLHCVLHERVPSNRLEVTKRRCVVAEKFISPDWQEQADEQWNEERLIDADGELILIRFKGKPSKERYEFIRDYLDFKIKHMRPREGHQLG